MDFNKDYYKILGISDKNCSADAIKASYRKLAKTHHPDKQKDKDDTMFKSINDAYEVLGNDVARKQYDNQSKYGNSYDPMATNPFSFFGGFGPFVDFSNVDFAQQAGTWGDFVSNLHGNFNRKEEQLKENLDIGYILNVSLKNVYNNEKLIIKFTRNVRCDACDWTGFNLSSGPSYECEACDGRGHTRGRTCEYCRGSGSIHTGTCEKCNGEKVIKKEEEFVLSNAFTITGSFTKYMPSHGHQSKYYRNRIGKVIIDVAYDHDNRYQVINKDLIYRVDLHFQHAINGYDFEYEHLDGKKYKIKIPEKTKDGDMLKIDGKGLIVDDTLVKRGDLLFKINVIIDYTLLP